MLFSERTQPQFCGVASSIPRYSQTSNITHTLLGNKLVDPSDVVGASPIGSAPTTSSFST